MFISNEDSSIQSQYSDLGQIISSYSKLSLHASQKGWGIYLSKDCHVNTAELITVYTVIKYAISLLSSRALLTIVLQWDVSILIHQGSRLISCIISNLHFLNKREQFVTAVHMARVGNVTADALSSPNAFQSEWYLDKNSFISIIRVGLILEVDLFATRDNAKLPV